MARTLRTSLRRLLTAGAAAAVLLTAAPAAGAAPATPGVAHALRPLAGLSAQRLATADLVAAAKWGTGSPVDDPVRERQVLDAVARQAAELGTDPRRTARIFRDQIEANKMVQRGLHRRWTADPSQAPTRRPDLGRVREEINRVNGALVRAIAASGAARTSPRCLRSLVRDTAGVRQERDLDALHTVALVRSVRSVCGADASRPASSAAGWAEDDRQLP
ncbi:chorismate mutase [Streptomyces albofaciens JCM 4342]|uniref:chorismate mutase n=1 Tax=Streptomyces albofaciens TaxID=66866 RepID=UPI00123934D7|nr:chorismate mutase [Streptomyces albofaciens]KAA6223257.1 chorismate mutase [Streptomyces albofaciens JCM 4342]